MDNKPQTLMIDNVQYVRADQVPAVPKGNRHVIIADRGWVFAGNLTEKDGFLTFTEAVHVRSWSEIGFDGLIKDPTKKAVLKKMAYPVILPSDSELFRIPVPETWGL